MKTLLFPHFTFVTSLYYLSYTIIYGFVTVFMQYKGFNNTAIGLLMACSSIICILFQFWAGSFLDHHPTLSVKTILLYSFIFAYIASILLFFSNQKWLIFICYTFIGSIMTASASFINILGMEYLNAKLALNYSHARGWGSFSFACASLIVGSIINHFSIESIFPLFFITHLLLLFTLFTLTTANQLSYSIRLSPSYSYKDKFTTFFKKNPLILLLFINIFLIYIGYSSVFNFQFNIIKSVGGTSQELGISNCIAAILELPAMALFTPLSKKFSYKNLLITSCLFFFLKIIAFLCADNIAEIYLAQCLQFFSYGLFIPASTYYLNSILPLQDKSKGQALLGIFTFGLSGLISSLLSGTILDFFSVDILLALEAILSFIGIIGICITCHFLTKNSTSPS